MQHHWNLARIANIVKAKVSSQYKTVLASYAYEFLKLKQ